MVKCIICSKTRPREQCKVIKLTSEELKDLEKIGAEGTEEFIYCQPCWRNLSDPRSGPAFMGSLFEIILTQGGVGNADRIAKKYREWLTQKAIESKGKV